MQSKQLKHPGSPPPKNLRGFIQQRRWWPQSFWIVKGWSWLIILSKVAGWSRRIARKSEERGRKTASWESALAGQRTCPHFTSCHDWCDWMWIWNPSLSPIFSWYCSFWLPSVPKTEIPSSWYTVWRQWRYHRGNNEYLGDQEKAFYFEGIKKLIQRWAKYSALKGEYNEK